jgi:Icc-related predicted phosphoesterase
MEIVALGDTHGEHRELSIPEGDILIFLGDLTDNGKKEEVEDFNDWLGKLDFEYKLVIAGNHDSCLIRDEVEPTELFSNAIYLEDEPIKIEGLRFYGLPWCTKLPGMLSVLQGSNFVITRNEMAQKVNQIPEDTDVLLSHAPPRGIMDRTFLLNPKIPFLRAGSKELRNRVEKISPSHHIFGHIHNQNSVLERNSTVFANVSISKYGGKDYSPRRFTINNSRG